MEEHQCHTHRHSPSVPGQPLPNLCPCQEAQERYDAVEDTQKYKRLRSAKDRKPSTKEEMDTQDAKDIKLYQPAELLSCDFGALKWPTPGTSRTLRISWPMGGAPLRTRHFSARSSACRSAFGCCRIFILCGVLFESRLSGTPQAVGEVSARTEVSPHSRG